MEASNVLPQSRSRRRATSSHRPEASTTAGRLGGSFDLAFSHGRPNRTAGELCLPRIIINALVCPSPRTSLRKPFMKIAVRF